MTTDLLIPQRVERCQAAITGYSDDNSFISLIDLLADARHWCDANDQDYCRSRSHRLPALPRRTQRRTNRRKENFHDLRNHIDQSLLRRPAQQAVSTRPARSRTGRSTPGCHGHRSPAARCRT